MYLKVRVTAGAKKETVKVDSPDKLTISVKQEAEANQANKRVIQLVAEHCKVPTNKVRIINGHHSPSKLVEVV